MYTKHHFKVIVLWVNIVTQMKLTKMMANKSYLFIPIIRIYNTLQKIQSRKIMLMQWKDRQWEGKTSDGGEGGRRGKQNNSRRKTKHQQAGAEKAW